ncbi:hypothetical protein [Nocardioides campestrisoli]|uniref:hypothetical protein n=1 Tax=Nocardioides campestrisoli TaxID=2736757 RepID=UPI0015E6AC8B|nr:hypothetical protein [Nocardioides campestrisoli]
MSTPDEQDSNKQYSNGLVGPFALSTEKVGMVFSAVLLIVLLVVLAVLDPKDPTSLYLTLPLPVFMFAMSAYRLRRMRREDEQEPGGR